MVIQGGNAKNVFKGVKASENVFRGEQDTREALNALYRVEKE